MMSLAILLLLMALCLLVHQSIEYDERRDPTPDKLWHKLIRTIHGWICRKEGDPRV